MKDLKPTAPVVAQAEIVQSKSTNVLLHLHVPEAREQERLKSIFSNTLAMRVIVTSSDVAIDLHSDDLARSAYEFLPRASEPSNSNHNTLQSGEHGNLAAVVAGKTLKEIEKNVIEEVISSLGGSVPKAAIKLEVSPSTLYRKREAWSAK